MKCIYCGQPMLKKGKRRKHDDDYRHASGCRYSRVKRQGSAIGDKIVARLEGYLESLKRGSR